LERTQKIQNRVRLQPSVYEVTVAITVLAWPARFLGQRGSDLGGPRDDPKELILINMIFELNCDH
jgi:hypothetical protein